MGNTFRPIAVMIWLSILILICSTALSTSDTSDPLSGIKEFHSNFINHDQQLEPSLVHPSYAGPQEPRSGTFPVDLMPHSPPVKEKIAMDNSHPEQQVQDMYALNSNMKRDIVFDDTQSGDPKGRVLKNSMNIAIRGNGQPSSKGGMWLDSRSDDNGIENMVDNAMANNALMGDAKVSKQHDGPVSYQSHTGSLEKQRLGNYMNIDVSGINVQATNTVEGGNAVATSNIEIKPVQIINVSPEVEEKLK